MESMGYNLKNKIVIVTGASSGIGRSCVYQLAEKGAKLVLVSRSEDKMAQIKNDLGNGNAIVIKADVSKRGEVDQMVKKVIAHYSRVDILINNAGIGLRGSIISAPLEHFDQLIETNLMGVLYGVRAVYPFMKEQGGGIIVNVSSIAGLKGFYNSGLYSMTKFAVSGLTESLSMEGADEHIKTLLVCPGHTATEFDNNIVYSDGKSSCKGKGISSDIVARAIIKGIVKNKSLVIVGRWCRTLYILNRISPPLTNFLLKRMY